MANPPRPSGKEMVQFLERLGFSIVRVTGSHHIMRRGAQHTTVPETLRIGTLRSILRDIDMSPADFDTAWNS